LQLYHERVIFVGNVKEGRHRERGRIRKGLGSLDGNLSIRTTSCNLFKLPELDQDWIMLVFNEYTQFLSWNVFSVLGGKHVYNIEGGCDDGMCNVSELGVVSKKYKAWDG
jgi:hypothetical protein